MTYRQKLITLKEWLPVIIEIVKKDLQFEHLRADRRFYKKFFDGKKRNKLTIDELVAAYSQEIIVNGNEKLAEFLCYRWLLKHTDLYNYFAGRLEVIDSEFDRIRQIDDHLAIRWVEEAIGLFGAIKTYLFAVLNSLMLSDKIFQKLSQYAEREKDER